MLRVRNEACCAPGVHCTKAFSSSTRCYRTQISRAFEAVWPRLANNNVRVSLNLAITLLTIETTPTNVLTLPKSSRWNSCKRNELRDTDSEIHGLSSFSPTEFAILLKLSTAFAHNLLMPQKTACNEIQKRTQGQDGMSVDNSD